MMMLGDLEIVNHNWILHIVQHVERIYGMEA